MAGPASGRAAEAGSSGGMKLRSKSKAPETCVPGAFRMSLQLIGSPSPFSLLDGAAGFPASCIFICCCRRPSGESPRLSCPSPLASSSLRVAPATRPHERLPAILRGCPRLLAFRLTPTVNLRVAPNLRSVCAPGCLLPSCPGFVPPGSTGWLVCELPRRSRLPAAPQLRLRVAPTPASAAGSMMIPG
jgi:hypothetical protein